MAFWRRPFGVIRQNLRVYVILSAAAYGLVVIGFVVGLIFPELNEARLIALDDSGTTELATSVFNAPPLFALLIFAVNLFAMSLARILLPSLVLPFAGLGFFGYWAVETGITLVQSTPAGWVGLIPHSLTLLIEVQAYVLLLLGAYLLGKAWIFPRTVGAPNHRRGYLWGLQRIGLLALPALVLLAVGAVWEAYSLRYLVYPLTELLL
ncbi:stage II sporulation protein M [Microbacterium sp. Sa4CUA7]|uniref:Stage II sporulation protein M n=1 Tax=Microbacterium pullorum TaxID=2762236 RepID=A0ABR8RZD0_9MICO|nr:stage II sporulation protein M [Microbacterium pullorum]